MKPADRLDEGADVFAGGVVGRDRGADGDAAVLRDLGGDVADAADVDVAVFLREAELGGQMFPDEVAVEHRDRAAADFEELGHEHIGDGGFAAAGKSAEEDGEALLVARREAPAQLDRDFGIGEPARDVAAFVEAGAELGAGEVEDAGVFRHFVSREIFILVLEVDHHLERHLGDADFLFVFGEEFLRVVGAVEWFAVGVLARAGVVAADDEVGAAVVLANEGVPDGFARAAHAHGEGDEGELGGAGRVFADEELVAADAGEVIDVAGLGHADDGMDEEAGFDLFRGAEGELDVGAVHRVARLEGDDAAPALAGELGAQLGGSEAEGLEVVMARELQAFETAADVPRVALVHQVGDAGMRVARAVEDGFSFGLAIGLPDVLDMQDGDHDAFAVAQGDLAAAGLEGFGKGFGNVERDRHRPEEAAGQFHVAANAFVIGFVHEAGEGREPAVQEHLEVADLARGEIPGREVARFGFGRGGGVAIEDEVDELAAVGRDEMAVCGRCFQRYGCNIVSVSCLLRREATARRSRPTCEPSGGSAGVHPRVKRPHVQSGLFAGASVIMSATSVGGQSGRGTRRKRSN